MENDGMRFRNDTIVCTVIRKVSEKEDCDELDLPPLYNSVDPEALNTLGASNKVQFDYIGYEITIENGTVTVDQ